MINTTEQNMFPAPNVTGDPPARQRSDGWIVEQFEYVSRCASGQEIVVEFPAPVSIRAVRATANSDGPGAAIAAITILQIPSDIRQGPAEENDELPAAMKQWVEEPAAPAAGSSQFLTFQGTQICWSPRRCAILAPGDRLRSIRNVIVEAAWYEQELSAIEQLLRVGWGNLESDMPFAFEVVGRDMQLQSQLRQRFLQVLLWRARLARIGPWVHSPHLYPATVSSQISERLRERTRMMHRHESASQQLEVFEQVYEQCGQRFSDSAIALKGHRLEWIIIAILLAQSLVTLIEWLIPA